MKTLVSIVVPFYNEEKSIRPLTEQVTSVFAGLPEYAFECLFVNDGSTDGTRAELERLAGEQAQVRPIHLLKNQGQSAALVAGMRRAKGAYLITLDGDLQNDPADIPKFLDLLKEYDCVLGVRAKRRDGWRQTLPSKIGNAAFRRFLDVAVTDAGCGLKGFRAACIEHIVPFNGVHRFFGVLMHYAGFRFVECPVTHHPRVHGASKYGIGNRAWRILYDLMGMRWLRKRYVPFRVEGE